MPVPEGWRRSSRISMPADAYLRRATTTPFRSMHSDSATQTSSIACRKTSPAWSSTTTKTCSKRPAFLFPKTAGAGTPSSPPRKRSPRTPMATEPSISTASWSNRRCTAWCPSSGAPEAKWWTTLEHPTTLTIDTPEAIDGLTKFISLGGERLQRRSVLKKKLPRKTIRIASCAAAPACSSRAAVRFRRCAKSKDSTGMSRRFRC